MAPTTRDPWLDNTKMLLVTLVVIGHSWGLAADTYGTNWAYDFLYFWHIPAFVLISGYLSKGMEWDRPHFKGLLFTLVVPYVLFEPALYYYRVALGQREDGLLLIHPHWAMWYLPVLFFWRLGTPFLKRHWLWLPAAVVISLIGGLWSGQIFYFARVMGLLPFFVLGLHLKKRHLARLDDPWVKVAAVAALVGIALVARETDEWARTAFLWYDAGYEDLKVEPATAAQARLAVMGIGALGAFSVLALVPRRSLGWFTRMGSATMVVYLFHGFFVKGAFATPYSDWAEDHVWFGFLLTTVLAASLAMLLASPPVRRALVWAVDPIGSVERRRRAASPGVPTSVALPTAAPSPTHAPRAGSSPGLPGAPGTTELAPPVAVDGEEGPVFPRAAPSTDRPMPGSPR